MELKIYSGFEDFVKAIEWNHEELKKELEEKVQLYKNMVYTEDQIKAAKSDRASLNKFVAALEDKRKDMKKKCMAPYEKFEKQMKELVAIVNEPINMIDTQVKNFEQKQKDEKLEKIKEFWDSCDGKPEWLECNAIFDRAWLNSSTSMKKVQEAILEKLNSIATNLETISKLPEFAFEALEEYKRTLDINRAISEGQRLADIQKRKEEAAVAEQERLKAEAAAAEEVKPSVVEVEEPVSVPEETVEKKTWISFEACLTVTQAKELKEFFNSRDIEFKAI